MTEIKKKKHWSYYNKPAKPRPPKKPTEYYETTENQVIKSYNCSTLANCNKGIQLSQLIELTKTYGDNLFLSIEEVMDDETIINICVPSSSQVKNQYYEQSLRRYEEDTKKYPEELKKYKKDKEQWEKWHAQERNKTCKNST